jgi:hypothetical protein
MSIPFLYRAFLSAVCTLRDGQHGNRGETENVVDFAQRLPVSAHFDKKAKKKKFHNLSNEYRNSEVF